MDERLGLYSQNKSGVKYTKISNIACFVKYEIDLNRAICKLRIFNRIRPGFIERTINDIDIENFSISEQLS